MNKKVTASVITGVSGAAALYLGRKVYDELLYRKQQRERIPHEVVTLANGIEIDVHVLPVCRQLWDEGIITFYSCQGGPTVRRHNKVHVYQAYVSILAEDASDACRILKDKNPTVDKNPGSIHPNRVAIRFDPSPEALGPYTLEDVI